MDLNVVEATELTEGLRYDWEAFRSMFAEAVDNKVWEQLGYTRMAEWLLDTFGEMRLPGVGQLAGTDAVRADTAAARVSRPGSRRSTTPTAREAGGRDVQTFFKPARR